MKTFKTIIQELYKPKQVSIFKDATKDVQGVDSRSQAWQGTLPDLMAEYGFKPLGSGKYGTVFGNKSYPYVIKVFMKDTAYLKWVNFAKENQDNPWVPKIKGKVVRIGEVFMAVRLEKLQPYTSGTNSESILYDAAAKGNMKAQKVIDWLEAHDNLLDWHDGNVMTRGNQLVIIDPLYNWFKGGRYTIDPNDTSTLKSIFVKP